MKNELVFSSGMVETPRFTDGDSLVICALGSSCECAGE